MGDLRFDGKVRLAHGGHPRGLLQVLRPPGRPFGGADLRLLGTLSDDEAAVLFGLVVEVLLGDAQHGRVRDGAGGVAGNAFPPRRNCASSR